MRTRRSFSIKTFLWLASVGLILLSLSLLLGGQDVRRLPIENRFGPGTLSTSALGHAGLYETLRRLGWRVERGAGGARAAARAAVLVVAEPDPRHMNWEYEQRNARARTMLVVLPKWRGVENPQRSSWVDYIEPIGPDVQRSVLAQIPVMGVVSRRKWPKAWPVNSLGVTPTGSEEVQLVSSPDLTPIVGGGDGMLLGGKKVDGRTVWILSDPDVMANHGIGSGDNLEFMLAALERLAGDGGRGGEKLVVFDESVHGYHEYLGSPIWLLGHFPYSIVTVLALVSVLFFVLAGVERFGGVRRPAPDRDFGMSALIDNSARLLEYSGHFSETLWSHIDMNMRLVATELHAPPGLEGAGLARWLDETAQAKRSGRSCLAILKTVGKRQRTERERARRLQTCAQMIFEWREAMLDRSRPGPQAGRHGDRVRPTRRRPPTKGQ